MKKLTLTALAIAILSAVTYGALTSSSAPPAHQVFINGQVLTMNYDNEIAEAVLLEDDRIIAVGSTLSILAKMPDSALVHDLKGKTLMPGIIDAHGHFPGSGLATIAANLNSPPIGPINSTSDIQGKLRALVTGTKKGEWVFGFGYDDTLLPDKLHPTRQQLDAISTEHPIYIMHISGHMGVANSLALELSGYDATTINPEGGRIVRDNNGQLSGLLEENAHKHVLAMANNNTLSDFLKMLDYTVDEYASQGVTTAQNGLADKKTLTALSWASRLGQIPFRLELWPAWDQLGELLLNENDRSEYYNSDRVRTKTVKIVADGSIQGYTGYLSEPYHTPFHGNAEHRGYPIMPREKLTHWVERLHQAGIQMAIHGNGDAAIDDIIFAFDSAQKKYPVEDPRLILIHSQMARDDQLLEMKRLGITPSFFSAHTYYWGDRHRKLFMGPERASRMSPAKSAEVLDLRYSLHLDTPVVPMKPMLLVWSAVNRLSTSGKVIGKEQQIAPMQALRAITIDAAWQIFREKELGSIEVGKFADLVVLNGNPLQNPEEIKNITVNQTFVGGVSIFKRKQE